MKLLVLISGGRTGSTLFQTLLDGHKQILQLPGSFDYNNFWQNVKNLNNNPKKISTLFINKNKFFFNSKLNKIERLDKLGKNKNQYFEADKRKFVKIFLNDFKKIKTYNELNLLYLIHFSYSKTINENIKYKKILFLHLQHSYKLSFLNNINYEIIYTVRNPIDLQSASFTKLINFKKRVKANSIYKLLRNTFHDFNNFNIHKKKIYVLKLEEIHTNSIKVLKKFCKIHKISFNKSMLRSTLRNLSWWGDSLSIKYLNGLNPNFKSKINHDIFFKKDINYINYLFYEYCDQMKYVNSIKKSFSFAYFFPLKIELLILKDLIFKRKKYSFNLYNFLYYLIKRIFLIKINLKKINLKII